MTTNATLVSVDASRTVGSLVTEKPSRSRVFERYGIDYCCGGKIPLEQACRAKKTDLQQVLDELQQADGSDAESGRDWAAASMTELADHIEQTHHAYLRAELPRLNRMVGRIREVHGERHPELVELEKVYQGLHDELTSHMMKEEQILFPMIRSMEAGGGLQASHCGSVDNPIRVMEHEHDSAGNALARMSELTAGHTPPDDACNTFRATLSGLQDLERDLHLHIHKENNILFPRASRREKELCGR